MKQMNTPSPHPRPLIAITPDLLDRNGHQTIRCTSAYGQKIWAAGGIGVVIEPCLGHLDEILDRFDGFVLSGGDDPKTEPFGVPTHPKTTAVHTVRQEFETRLLEALEQRRPNTPVLGVCLGMQMMALCSGGKLDQYMPDSLMTHDQHWENEHEILVASDAEFQSGMVRSKHHQAVSDPGSMRVLAHAPDGVIEAIENPQRGYYIGVQWHPERTADDRLGQWFFDRLVESCRD